MTFSLNLELASGIATLIESFGEIEPFAVGDVASRRNLGEPLQRQMHAEIPARR
jgi:hypothetical protein